MAKREKCFDNIAKLVIERRKLTGISQMKLSLLLGYKNSQFISNVERGLCSIPIEKICDFCKHTETETDSVIKAILWDHQMTIQGVVIKDPKRRMIKFKFDF